MVACQLALMGVERTVAMVNKSSYRQIDLLGIDLAISPRVLCTVHLRFVRSTAIGLLRSSEGRAEVLDLQARFGVSARSARSTSWACKGSVVGAIVERMGHDPHGDSVVRDGDHVIVFSLPENVEESSACSAPMKGLRRQVMNQRAVGWLLGASRCSSPAFCSYRLVSATSLTSRCT